VEVSLRRRAKRGSGGVAALTVTLLAIVGAAGVAGIQRDASAASGRLAFRELMRGSRGSNLPGERMRAVGRVLRNASQAARVLRAWGLDSRMPKSVDFDRDSLVVVLDEYQPTGGYRARVSRVVVEGRQAVVTASVRYEGGELATQSIERPWVVVSLKRAALAGVRSEVRIRRPARTTRWIRQVKPTRR
jgi:PrcB C-terminal